MNRFIEIVLSLLFFLCTSISVYSINIDSLKYELNNADNLQKQIVLSEISEYYYSISRDSSFIYQTRIIDTHFGNYKELAEIYHNLGKLYIKKKYFEKAYHNLKHALNLYELESDASGTAKCKIDLALVYSNFYDFEIAMNYLMDAIRYFKENTMVTEEAFALVRLGDNFFKLGQYENAFELYSKSLKMRMELNDSLNIAESFFKLGQVYASEFNFQKSLNSFNGASVIYEKFNTPKDLADTYFEMGKVYFKMDEFSNADVHFGKSIKIYEKIQDLHGIAQAYLALANYYLSMDDKAKGIYYFNEALYAAEFVNSKELLVDIYRNLSQYYENEKLFEDAIKYYKKYSSLKDSLSKEAQSYKFAQIKSLLENQEKSEIIRKLEADSFFKEQALNKQKNFLVASVISIILAIIVLIVIITYSRRRKKTNQQLSEKNQSLQKAEKELINSNNELHKSETRLKEIVLNMPVLVSASDENGVFIFWNKTCEFVFGYSASEVINNKEFADQLIEKSFKTQMLSLNRQNTNYDATEYAIETKNGEKRDIVWTNMSNVYPVEGWAGWHVGIDVTERNVFAKSLERETAILNSILDSIPHPIFYKDKNGVYQRANHGFYELYKLSENELIGKSDKHIFSKKDARYFIETDTRIFKNGVPHKELRWSGLLDEEGLLFDTIKTPIYNSHNQVIGIVGISFDMTERYYIEQELKKQKEKAEEADRLKSAFLANMSHEIRSPMNAIIGFSNLVSDSFELDSEIATYMDYIKQSGTNLLQLVDDIIDIAKLEAGQLKIRKDKFYLDEMLEKLKVTIDTSFVKAKKANIPIRLNIPKDSDNPIIISDELRIKQILINFLSNALKFTDEGYIEFGYEKMPGSEILFYTKDTGIGIADSYKELIFNRFGQVKETYTRNTSGTGLGLAISKSIVELLGGQIWVDSIENKGSTFYFKIPVEYSSQKPPAISEPLYEIKDFNWSGKHILIVEDDDMNFKVLKSLLEKSKVSIIRAGDGLDAVNQALTNNQLDLILMDIQLPLLNGYDASKQIKKGKDIPIIAITAYAMPSELEKSIEAGCNHFIIKPFNRNELLYKISILLEKN